MKAVLDIDIVLCSLCAAARAEADPYDSDFSRVYAWVETDQPCEDCDDGS